MDRKAEHAEKRRRVLGLLEAGNYTAAVLTGRAAFSWYTAGGCSCVNAATEAGTVAIVVTPAKDVAVADNIEAPRQLAEEIGALDLELATVPWHDPAARATVISDLAGERPVSDLDCGVPAVVDPAAVAALRFALTEGEIARYRPLGKATAAALEVACRAIRPGVTEHMVAGDTAACLRASGLMPWVVLVAADERIEQFRHPLPTAGKVAERCMVVVCAEAAGLIAAATRMVNFVPLTDELRGKHRACVQVDAKIIHATRPGVLLSEVFGVAQQAYADAGFPGEWEHHHQGGSIGYGPREVIATPGARIPVERNQAFAWNPSIRGTKSEDTILVNEVGCEILTPSGTWPMLEVDVDGTAYLRPDILVNG